MSFHQMKNDFRKTFHSILIITILYTNMHDVIILLTNPIKNSILAQTNIIYLIFYLHVIATNNKIHYPS